MMGGAGASMFSGGTIGNVNSIGSMDNMMQSGGLMNNFNPMQAFGAGTGYAPGAFGNAFMPGQG